ncbi:MAG: hypothetical protein P8J87_16905 [Verrucomicrobiales bacterium]|nr:hypothetical protein [Verrucomicrobiales bacterium]
MGDVGRGVAGTGGSGAIVGVVSAGGSQGGGGGEAGRFGAGARARAGWAGAGAAGRRGGWERKAAMLEQAAMIVGDKARDREIEMILAGMGAVELGNMLEGMDLEAGPVRSRLTREALGRWAEVDAVGALRFVETMEGEGSAERGYLRDRVLERWAIGSPEAAWAWVVANGGVETSERDLARVIAGSGEGEPERMFAFLEAHGPEFGKAQLGAVGQAVRDVFMNGFGDEVKGWVEGLGEGQMRDAAVRALVDGMGRYDAEAAYAWVSGMGLDDEAMGAIRGRLAETWARTDPQGAAEWATGEGEGSGKDLQGVMRRWLQSDYEGAATWLAAQEPSPMMDRSLEQYIYSAMRYDPAETWAWAETITDDKRRIKAFETLAKRLKAADPAVLERTVLASSLSDEAKLKMLGVKLKLEKPVRTKVKEKRGKRG